MNSKDLYGECTYIKSIRENLQTIGNIFFEHTDDSKNQIDNISKAQLIKAIDYLDKEKDSLPTFYKNEINVIIKAARYKLSRSQR